MLKKPELLAPAGSADALKAALLAGADAVYLAGKRFGARAFASNFDEEGLKWARKITKALGRKLYITLNTIVFEHEWNLLEKALDFMEALQPDALIIQDIGIAVELRKRGSRIPLHLSTQGAWYGQGGAEQLKELGISRVILPRETTREEIADIVKNNTFEVEVFVHGAMCYSISGRCFWSAALGPRSGNRGTCAQPCRREYKIIDSNYSGCIFSPRDMRLINEIQPLIQTGVSSLKIEGRMKSPEYVYQVVKAYRAALDGDTKIDLKALDEVFSRASSTGFFNGVQKPSQWKTGNNPGREGLVVGITTGKTSEGLTELVRKIEIKPGDGLFWYEGNEQKGARITWVQADKKKAEHVWVRGLPRGIAVGTEIRRTSKSSDEDWETKWNHAMERNSIELFWFGKAGEKLVVSAAVNGYTVHAETEELLSVAKQKGLDEGPINDKFRVIGENYQVSRHDTDNLDKKLFISASAFKQLKRDLAEELAKAEKLPSCVQQTNDDNTAYKKQLIDKSKVYKTNPSRPQIRIRLWNNEFQFNSDLKADIWVLPWNCNHEKANKVIQAEKLMYWLPPVLNLKQYNEIYNQLKKLESGRFLCFGWEAFKLAKALPKLSFELDWCFNVANLSSLAYMKKEGIEAVLSKEWKDEDIPTNLEAFRAPMAYNPLVSYTRFADAVRVNQEISNSHNDKFFILPLGNGITAMFLEEKPAKPSKIQNSIQIDVAISPKENPTQVAEHLNRIISGLRK